MENMYHLTINDCILRKLIHRMKLRNEDSLQSNPSRGQRTFDPLTWKINQASIQYSPITDDCQDSFLAADRILVCVKITVNVYHQLIQDLPGPFRFLRYERCTRNVALLAYSEKKDDIWDDWDQLPATMSEVATKRSTHQWTRKQPSLSQCPAVSKNVVVVANRLPKEKK
eukprot:scaffold3838_cov183-Ochromonas_danica.AAC.2